MLKLAGLLFVLLLVFGGLSFMLHVAVVLTRIAFFMCLGGLAVTLIAPALRKP